MYIPKIFGHTHIAIFVLNVQMTQFLFFLEKTFLFQLKKNNGDVPYISHNPLTLNFGIVSKEMADFDNP